MQGPQLAGLLITAQQRSVPPRAGTAAQVFEKKSLLIDCTLQERPGVAHAHRLTHDKWSKLISKHHLKSRRKVPRLTRNSKYIRFNPSLGEVPCMAQDPRGCKSL